MQSPKEINDIIVVDRSVVNSHLSAIYKALKVSRKTHLIAFMFENPEEIQKLNSEQRKYLSPRFQNEIHKLKSQRLKTAFLLAELRDDCADLKSKRKIDGILKYLALPLL